MATNFPSMSIPPMPAALISFLSLVGSPSPKALVRKSVKYTFAFSISSSLLLPDMPTAQHGADAVPAHGRVHPHRSRPEV
jgi:hypothetical protein